MDVLCLGQQNWDHCWTAKQQLTTRLAERGHRVLYLDPDFARPDEAEAIRAASVPGSPGLRRRGPGELWTCTALPLRRARRTDRPDGAETPRAPSPAPAEPGRAAGLRAAARQRLQRWRRAQALRGALRTVGFHAPLVLCLHPGQIAAIRPANPQALVYYAVDEYTAYGGLTDETRRRVRAWEEEILAQADVALGVSPVLRDRFAAICPASYVLENGSDVEHYRPETLARIAPHPGIADVAGPVIGFIGQLDTRIDQDLLAEIAARRPHWTIALAGRRTVPMPRLEALPNVRFLGFQPYEALPGFARRVDVWTVPYVETELTHACNPLKVFEYLATARPVVSRPLDGLGVCRDVLSLAGGAEAFVAAVDAALADPGRGRAERLDLAERNDWYARVHALEARMYEAIGTARKSGRWFRAMAPLPPARFLARASPEWHGPASASWSRRAGLRARILNAWLAGMVLRGGRPAARPRRILVTWRGHLGDYIALTPMLSHLRRRFPAARIDLGLLRGSVGEGIFARSADVDSLELFERGRPFPERLRHALRLLTRRYDLVVGSGEEHFMMEGLLVGARRYVGLYERWRQGLAGRALRRDPGRHEAENNLALAEAVTGAPAEDADRWPRLDFDEAEVARKAGGVLASLGLDAGTPVLLVHPGSKRATRRWPADRLAGTLARVLDRRPDLAVVLTGTEGERPLAEELLARLPDRLRPRVRDATGRTDLAGLAGLLDRADAVLSHDTGVMHFARARGAPLVAVLGPENHRLWGPYPEGPAPAWAIRREVPCAPCRLDHCPVHYCMRSVPVDDVERAVLAALARGRDPDAGALQLDLERRSWSALARDGFELPIVSVIVDATRAPDALDAVLPAIERQTYPGIEVVHVRRRGAPWSDGRDAERQRTLPIRAVEADGPDAAWSAAMAAARGGLVVRAAPGLDWRSSRLALDVAAATRTPAGAAHGFFDGTALARPDERWDALLLRPGHGADGGLETPRPVPPRGEREGPLSAPAARRVAP